MSVILKCVITAINQTCEDKKVGRFMYIKDALKEIRDAKNTGNLIIFVGAGVSLNSGLPSWEALVKEIAKEIDYQIPDKLSSDLMLRIPEYYYQKDNSDGKTDYFSFLIRHLTDKNCDSNALDKLIVDLLPHHIITTNFDHLLEKTKSANINAFQVVYNDSKLLANNSQRYIIKMHGDIDDPKSIILRENDYLQYEQSHPIISNYIKSLLADHIFLYVGYSLNDYNLNIIISWINYYYERYGVEFSNNNYICVDRTNPFEEMRFESKGIEIIDLSQLNKEDVDYLNTHSGLTDDVGKKLYAFLSMINDDKKYYPVALSDKIKAFLPLKRISVFDLMKTLRYPIINLVQLQLSLDEKYANQLIDLYHNNSLGKSVIINSGITGIEPFSKDGLVHIKENNELESKDLYYQLWINNQFSQLYEQIHTDDDVNRKLHYYPVFGESKTALNAIIDSFENNYSFNSYQELVLDKARSLLATNSFGLLSDERKSEFYNLTKYLPDSSLSPVGLAINIIKDNDYLTSRINAFFNKQEEKYKNRSTWYSEPSYYQIWKMQSYVYDLYFFGMINDLPLETIGWMRKQYEPYIKAILCSYQPITKGTSIQGFAQTDLRPYVINAIDYDIITKMLTPKALRKIIKNYHSDDLMLDEEVGPISKFDNLCKELIDTNNGLWFEYFSNSLLVLAHTILDDKDNCDIINSVIYVLDNTHVCNDTNAKLIYESILHFIRKKKIKSTNTSRILLKSIIDFHEITQQDLDQCYWYIIDELSDYKDEKIEKKVKTIIDGIDQVAQPSAVCRYHRLLNQDELYQFLETCFESLNIVDLFVLYLDGYLTDYEGIDNYLQERIVATIRQRKSEEAHGMHSFPDYASIAIESYLGLFLDGKVDDISFLEDFSDQSNYIAFFLDEENFDYHLVDINEYLWQRIAISDKYSSLFKDHLSEIVDEELWRNIRANRLDRNLNITIYHYLFSEEDLKKI